MLKEKTIKKMVIIYIGVALFAYAVSFQSSQFESRDDIRNKNKSIVLLAK